MNTYRKSFPQPRGPKNISVDRQTFLQTPLRLGQDQGKAAASFSTTEGTTRMEGYWFVSFFRSIFNLYFVSTCPCVVSYFSGGLNPFPSKQHMYSFEQKTDGLTIAQCCYIELNTARSVPIPWHSWSVSLVSITFLVFLQHKTQYIPDTNT